MKKSMHTHKSGTCEFYSVKVEPIQTSLYNYVCKQVKLPYKWWGGDPGRG